MEEHIDDWKIFLLVKNKMRDMQCGSRLLCPIYSERKKGVRACVLALPLVYSIHLKRINNSLNFIINISNFQ